MGWLLSNNKRTLCTLTAKIKLCVCVPLPFFVLCVSLGQCYLTVKNKCPQEPTTGPSSGQYMALHPTDFIVFFFVIS